MLRTLLINAGSRAGVVLIGTVVAGTGWWFSHFVSPYLATPIIEYEMQEDASGNLEVTVNNMARDHKYDKLDIVLHIETSGLENLAECSGFDPSKMLTRAEAVGSTYLQDSMPKILPTVPYSVTYALDGFQPQASVVLLTTYHCQISPTVHIGTSSSSAHLVEKGYLTLLVRNEILIFGALLLLWISAAMWALYRIPRHTESA